MSFDGQVVRFESELQAFKKDFVFVRLTRAEDIDLGIFGFDFDTTWSAVFLNADMTVYGRYGTRDPAVGGPEALVSTASLARAMRRVLALHGNYPSNRKSLAGKKPTEQPWSTPRQVPVISRYLRGARRGGAKCVHCHQIYTGMRQSLLLSGKPLPEQLVWPHPPPTRLGLTIDPVEGNLVTGVAPGSVAQSAGLKTGDLIDQMDGQPIISIADMQWVLHGLASGASVDLSVLRNQTRTTHSISLPTGWRRASVGWRMSRLDLMPGLGLTELPTPDRAALGINPGRFGLRVGWIFAGHPVRKSGIRVGDVLVEFDGRSDIADLGRFIELLGRDYAGVYKKKGRVPIVVLRKGKRLPLRIPLVFGQLEA